MPGDPRIKVARKPYRTRTTADAIDRNVDPAEAHRLHVAGRLAGATGRAVQAAACLHTVAPDRGFIIDCHPDMERVLVVSAYSGHGFTRSAGIGQAVAEVSTRGRSRIAPSPFALARLS